MTSEVEEIQQPESFLDMMGGPPPQVWTETKKLRGRIFVAGAGPRDSELMLIATAAQEVEASDVQYIGRTNTAIPNRPGFLQGPSGMLLRDLMRDVGFQDHHYYYTALCKWLLPPKERSKPTKEAVAYGMVTLDVELRAIKPKLVVAFGKPVYEKLLPNAPLPHSKALYGFFHSEPYNCTVLVMEDVFSMVMKPENVERFRIGIDMARGFLEDLHGIVTDRIPTNYRVIQTLAETEELVRMWEEKNLTCFSVDCEWGGEDFIDGQLRSFQICWAKGEAAYFRFCDDKRNYVFDVEYARVGHALGRWLNRPEVKYIGHHIAADFPWMSEWLGLEWYDKAMFDSEFCQQVADEYVPLGLDELALRYTDLGRYDMDLEIWKKQNKQPDRAGYAFVPDNILIPYACKDVDTVMRSYPVIMRKLFAQNLWTYCRNYSIPFTTDVFTNFALVGLPTNLHKMDTLRTLFQWARGEMHIEFLKLVHQEAKQLLVSAIAAEFARQNRSWPAMEMMAFMRLLNSFTDAQPGFIPPNLQEAVEATLRSPVTEKITACIAHFLDSKAFKPQSGPMMQRWLFKVKGYTPIKSTADKENGKPSMAWEKVMGFEPKVRAQYNPSVDQQSIQILADQHDDEMLYSLLQLKATGNLCKAFLREADVDDEGNLVKENGLHYWVCSDGRIHGQLSTTETGRPRSWKPNCLNWPKFVNKRINKGILKILKLRDSEGRLPENLRIFLTEPIPSIRSIIDVTSLEPLSGSMGWCIVESDYQTAEIRGQAFISGDPNLIRLMTEPDYDFGLALYEGKEVAVRLRFSELCGVTPELQNPEFILAYVSEGVIKQKFTEADLLRDAQGNLTHPPHDLHWSIVEIGYGLPREIMNKDKDRGAGKVVNFSSAYGATPATIERKIEADTGAKPPPGTGDKLLAALDVRQEVANQFLKDMELVPENEGQWVAESGRIRHCKTHRRHDVGTRFYRSQLAALAREMRNFPFQNSVADTAAKAANNLLRYYREHGMHARPMAVLYDAICTICPVEERFEVAKLHQRFMTDENMHYNHGREWNYPIETDFVLAWSEPPSKEWQKKLDDPSWGVYSKAA